MEAGGARAGSIRCRTLGALPCVLRGGGGAGCFFLSFLSHLVLSISSSSSGLDRQRITEPISVAVAHGFGRPGLLARA